MKRFKKPFFSMGVWGADLQANIFHPDDIRRYSLNETRIFVPSHFLLFFPNISSFFFCFPLLANHTTLCMNAGFILLADFLDFMYFILSFDSLL